MLWALCYREAPLCSNWPPARTAGMCTHAAGVLGGWGGGSPHNRVTGPRPRASGRRCGGGVAVAAAGKVVAGDGKAGNQVASEELHTAWYHIGRLPGLPDRCGSWAKSVCNASPAAAPILFPSCQCRVLPPTPPLQHSPTHTSPLQQNILARLPHAPSHPQSSGPLAPPHPTPPPLGSCFPTAAWLTCLARRRWHPFPAAAPRPVSGRQTDKREADGQTGGQGASMGEGKGGGGQARSPSHHTAAPGSAAPGNRRPGS